MPANCSAQEVEAYLGNTLEEGYWVALLCEGEYAKSTDHEPNSHLRPRTRQQSTSTPSAEIAINQDDWASIAKIQENDETVLLEVVGFNRGGLLVEWKSLRGFVPASQLLLEPPSDSEHQRKLALANRVGQMLDLRVIELNVEKNRLIFSERAAQVESGKRSQTLQKLAVNSVVEGYVTNLCHFGAFIDLGGVEGLIHISELSWGRVTHPTDMLTSGEKIKVYILDINEA